MFEFPRWVGYWERCTPIRRTRAVDVSSTSPVALFRILRVSDSARGGETLDQVKARRGTVALSHWIIGLVSKIGRRQSPEATFAVIEAFFDAVDATPRPSPDGNT